MTNALPKVATCLWLIAFFSSFTWVDRFEPEYIAISFIALISATALSDAAGIEGRSWSVPRSPVLIAGGVLWLLSLLSVAFSEIPFVAWIYFFFFTCLPLSVAFFIVGHNAETRLRWAEQGIELVLTGLALYALYQYFMRPDLLVFGRVHAPLTDPNGLAAILSLGLFLSARKFLTPQQHPTPRDWIYFGLLAGAFMTTGSRGAFLAAGLMGVGLLGLTGFRHVAKKTWGMAAGLIVLMLTIGIFLAPAGQTNPLRLLSGTLQEGPAAAMSERPAIWGATLKLISAHPWLGTGMGTFYYYYPAVRPATDGTAGYMAHNDPLQFAVEMGVGGMVMFYVIALLGVIRTFRALRVLPKSHLLRLKILAPSMGLAALGVHAHLNFNLHILPCLMLAGYAFALWYMATAQALDERFEEVAAPSFLNTATLQALFLIVAFVMAVLAAAPVYTQRLIASASSALEHGDLDTYARSVNLADTLSGGMNAQAYLLAARLPLETLAQQDVPLSDLQKNEMRQKADSLLQKARLYNPRDAAIIFAQARLADLSGDRAVADELLTEALRINPFYLQARLMLADHVAAQGNPKLEADLLYAGVAYPYRADQELDITGYYRRTMAALQAQGRVAEAAEVKNRLEAQSRAPFSTIP